jgi:mono/diheme cytochrome c family protein
MNRWLLAGTATAVLLIGMWFVVGRNAESEINPNSSTPTPAANSSDEEQAIRARRESALRGEEVFFNNCAVCHANETDEVIVGPSLKNFFNGMPAPLADGTRLPQTDDAVRKMIEKGTDNMPPLGEDLGDQKITDVIAYLHTL